MNEGNVLKTPKPQPFVVNGVKSINKQQKKYFIVILV